MSQANPDRAYCYEELKAACLSAPDMVVVGDDVVKEANEFYPKIKTKADIKRSIGNDELRNLRHEKQVEHRIFKVPIDVYYFELGGKTGYLAFFQRRGIWKVKSFKENDLQLGDPSKSPPMLRTLKELGLPKNFKTG